MRCFFVLVSIGFGLSACGADSALPIIPDTSTPDVAQVPDGNAGLGDTTNDTLSRDEGASDAISEPDNSAPSPDIAEDQFHGGDEGTEDVKLPSDTPPFDSTDDQGDAGVQSDVLQGSDLSDDTGPQTPDHPCPGEPDEMVFVPGGPFLYGPAAIEQTLPDYCLHRTEVSADQWNQCVAEGGCESQDAWDMCQSDDPDRPHQCQPDKGHYPANWLDWFRALDYCTWAGMRLPSTREWEKAARGEQGKPWPWGATLSCDKAHYGRGSVFSECSGAGGYPDSIMPVEAYGDIKSPYGAINLVGNVREWVEFRDDLGHPPIDGDSGISKGGDWREGDFLISPMGQDTTLGPGIMSQGHGFRCAADPITP